MNIRYWSKDLLANAKLCSVHGRAVLSMPYHAPAIVRIDLSAASASCCHVVPLLPPAGCVLPLPPPDPQGIVDGLMPGGSSVCYAMGTC